MSQSIQQGDNYINGNLGAKTFSPPAGCITDAAVVGAAGILASKLEHQHQITTPLGNHAAAAATLRQAMHRVYGATGDLIAFHVTASVVPTGGDSVTVTLKKNGSAILSASVVIDSGNTVYVGEAGAFSSTDVVAGDLLEAEITAVSGTSGKGIAAHLVMREDAAP